MSVVYCKKNRRQFLVGTGKTLLALPFIPSLLSRDAAAQMAAQNRRMIIFSLGHNSMTEAYMNPNLVTNPVGSMGVRELRMSTLAAANTFSSIYSHPLINTLRNQDQMTVVRGLDYQFNGYGHGSQHMGGNFVDNDGGNSNNSPTIDSVIELSRSVYPDNTPIQVRKAIRLDLNGENPFYQKIGGITTRLPSFGMDRFNTRGIVEFYNEVFSSLTNGTTTPADTTASLKSNILNRVHGSYVDFRNNRRISSEDLQRVEQHMSFLSDLQRSFASSADAPQLVCTRPNSPSTTTNPLIYTGLYLDLLVVALKCGLTKMASVNIECHDPRWIPGLSIPAAVDGLHDAIHGSNPAAPQSLKVEAYRIWKQWHVNLIADRFLNPMNEQEGSTGRTYLDNMLTCMLSECGMEPFAGSGHGRFDYQQVLFGSMAGRLRAGRYYAYPNAGTLYAQKVPYNAFLVTLLELMGVPASEYTTFNTERQGFGKYSSNPGSNPHFSRGYSSLSEMLTG